VISVPGMRIWRVRAGIRVYTRSNAILAITYGNTMGYCCFLRKSLGFFGSYAFLEPLDLHSARF